MRKLTCMLLLALIIATALLSACGNADRDDFIGTDTAPSIEDIQPPAAEQDMPEIAPESDAPVTIPKFDFDAEELRDNISSIDRVKFIEDGYVYRQCWLTDSEISAFVDCLSGIDLSKYETVDWKTEDIPDEGYWMDFVFTAGDKRYTVCPHWCLSINGVGYKWEYDENYYALCNLAVRIRDSHEDWGEVTDDPSEFEKTAAVLEDEELRYNVESVKFHRLIWKSWYVENYYLTNSEINEFLDALSELEFTEENETSGIFGSGTVDIVSEDTTIYLSFHSPAIDIAPIGSDGFTLENWYNGLVKEYCFDQDSKVFVFIRDLEERVVRADLDAKYREDRS